MEGISSSMYYIETVMYIQTVGLALSKGIGFSVYGENAIICAQNVVIILLIWSYSKNIGFAEKLLDSACLVSYFTVIFGK